MIRYPGALIEIEAKIGPRWKTRAAKRTQKLQEIGGYSEVCVGPDGKEEKLPPFWTSVKKHYIKAQFGKCAFCETRLERGAKTEIQWDIEHFRPKDRVRRWPIESSNLHMQYQLTPMGGEAPGYHLLAYCLGNLAAVCKTCNSLKSDFFPICGPRSEGGLSPQDYSSERPYLTYPLSSDADNPTDLLSFRGATAVPRYDTDEWTENNLTARVIIDMFQLNRDGLLWNRADWIANRIWPWVLLARDGHADALGKLELSVSESAPFSNCATSFIALCLDDEKLAMAKVDECNRIVTAGL